MRGGPGQPREPKRPAARGLGELLRDAIQALGLTIEQAAAFCGTSTRTMHSWIGGTRVPRSRAQRARIGLMFYMAFNPLGASDVEVHQVPLPSKPEKPKNA